MRTILAKCGGLAGRAELLTGIAGASSRPVRKIVLRARLRANLGTLTIASKSKLTAAQPPQDHREPPRAVRWGDRWPVRR